MNVIETLDQVDQSDVRGQETVIHFEEGLIGFSDFKNFNPLENDYLAPFRLLRAVESSDVGFLVFDPSSRVPEYCELIPDREWASIGVTSRADRLALRHNDPRPDSRREHGQLPGTYADQLQGDDRQAGDPDRLGILGTSPAAVGRGVSARRGTSAPLGESPASKYSTRRGDETRPHWAWFSGDPRTVGPTLKRSKAWGDRPVRVSRSLE